MEIVRTVLVNLSVKVRILSNLLVEFVPKEIVYLHMYLDH